MGPRPTPTGVTSQADDPHTVTPRRRGWVAVRRVALAAVPVLLAGLLLRPEVTLTIFWKGLVPLLPAVFLLHPALWRNVCPLATVGMGAREVGGPPTARARWSRGSAVLGIALLFILVPARHLWFDTSGPALAVLLVSLCALAWLAGRILPRKAGFCNGFCPVLPVERLYGQRPLLTVSNPRCADCTACAPVGCLDLSPEKVVAQMTGPRRKGRTWTWTGFGAFAAAFPGFVAGYFTVPAASAGGAWWAGHVHVWGWAAASWAAVTAAVTIVGARPRTLGPVLAGAAAAVYYAFTIPGSLEALGTPPFLTGVVVAAAVLLVATWTARALRRLSVA